MPNAATLPDFMPNVQPSERKPPASENLRTAQRTLGDVPPGVSGLARVRPVAKSTVAVIAFPSAERLLNAREVANRLGVSERWVRDHTTRRSPKIRAVKLGPMVRYKREDVEQFMENLSTSGSFSQAKHGV